MKIAIIVNPLIPVPPEKYGGIERIVYLLIRELIQDGHEVVLFAHKDSHAGCRLVSYRESAFYTFMDLMCINLRMSSILFRKFDLVHTFGRMSNIAVLMPAKIPKIVSYQLPPTLTQIKKAMRLAYPGSLFFTACSEHIAEEIRPYGTVETIFNGVDPRDYQFKDQVKPDGPLVFLGRIQHEKGTAIAIQIALETKRKLIIAGNIPAEQHHQQYFAEKVQPWIDGKQIQYIGAVNDVEKSVLLGEAAALLMPVQWAEPFGIVMTEALACGTPVIGFGLGAVPEVVENGVTGFVCDSIEEMISAVYALPTLNRGVCRESVEKKFSAAVLGRQYIALYKRVVSK